jgi:endoglucanase Acf2
MYIEFRLPTGAGGMAAGVALNHINIDIDSWVRQHNIKSHRTKLHKYTYRLSLTNEKEYTLFALTWNPKYSASTYFEFKNPK